MSFLQGSKLPGMVLDTIARGSRDETHAEHVTETNLARGPRKQTRDRDAFEDGLAEIT